MWPAAGVEVGMPSTTSVILCVIGLWCLVGLAACGAERSAAPSAASKGATPATGKAPTAAAATASAPVDGITEGVYRACLAWFDWAIESGAVAKMVPTAEKAAERLIAGGDLQGAGNPGFCDELDVRAGGFPFARRLNMDVPGNGDVVLIGHFRPDGSDFEYGLLNAEQRKRDYGQALVVHFGSHRWPHLRKAAATTGPQADDRLVLIDTNAPAGGDWPAVCVGQMATTALAWAFHGEVMSAATRRNRTLATYASDCEPGGYEWDDSVRGQHLHPTYRVAAVEAGKLGNEYLRICRSQIEQFARTQTAAVRGGAARMARCMYRGGSVSILTSGHIHVRGALMPSLPGLSLAGREDAWNGVRYDMKAGQCLLWMGYLRYPKEVIDEALAGGAEAVVFTVDDGPSDSRRTHVRGCWADFDTVVSLPRYPIKVLPSSGVVQTPQWYSILAEAEAAYRALRRTRPAAPPAP